MSVGLQKNPRRNYFMHICLQFRKKPLFCKQACDLRPAEDILKLSIALQEGRDSQEAMEAALNFVIKWGGLLAIILIPIWPLLALPAGVFSEGKELL